MRWIKELSSFLRFFNFFTLFPFSLAIKVRRNVRFSTLSISILLGCTSLSFPSYAVRDQLFSNIEDKGRIYILSQSAFSYGKRGFNQFYSFFHSYKTKFPVNLSTVPLRGSFSKLGFRVGVCSVTMFSIYYLSRNSSLNEGDSEDKPMDISKKMRRDTPYKSWSKDNPRDNKQLLPDSRPTDWIHLYY